jgi:ribosomal protein S18 acetylase RimI-like enzyme
MTSGRAGLVARARLREETPADADFLLSLYATTRADELTGLPAPQRAAFVRQQLTAQDAHFRAVFPAAERRIVCVGDAPVGRLYVDRSGGEVRIVDVALVPEFRGKGIGEALLRAVLADAAAAGVPARLHVLADNPARRLYLRLGFRSTGWTGPYEQMEWLP